MANANLVLGDIGTQVEARVRVGADFGPNIVHLVDDADVPIDLTGCTIGGEIRRAFNTPVLQNLTITITDAPGGVFTFTLPRTITRLMKAGETLTDETGKHVWYMWLRDSSGREFPVYSGPFIVVWGSTV